MIQLAAERGYGRVSVQDLAGIAKVSSRAFYKNFRGKEDCFIRTHEQVVRRTAKHVLAAQSGERDWRERLRLGFRAFVRELEREPQAARLALVEAYLDGPAARAQARKAELLFGAMLADSFGRAPNGPPVSSAVVEAIVAGIAEVARRHVLSGGQHSSSRLGDELMEWALTRRQRAVGTLPTSLWTASSKAAAMESLPRTSDRDLSLAAVAKLAVTEGYAYLTVPRIRAAAGISRQRFDAEFTGVDDCLSAAREKHLDAALAKVSRIRDSAPEEAGLRAAVLALCAQFADDSALARLCFAVDCVGSNYLERGGGVQSADGVAKALYGEKAMRRPSVAIQAGAGMVWTMIEIHSLSKHRDALKRAAPSMAAMA